ncbi:MAG: pyridoxamine 5'-phosphate oxidase [Bacteroidetes bacterium]|nr:pyridoxamine 5'-phosphate oxidase [Bacteroidota bacterium]
MEQFNVWFNEALKAEVLEPNAMTLATASSNGSPSCRVVLLKGVDNGFVFFTNYLSRKGSHLLENPNACLNFFWPELERQVRIEGSVEKVSALESDDYYNSRPFGSQIGAWASPQSQKIEGRELLEQRVEELQKEFSEDTIKRPEHWGGFRLRPDFVEFWQGRPSRLHDRICYLLENDRWNRFRVAP